MKTYLQRTLENGVERYNAREISAEEMVRMLAQMILENQAGGNNILHIEHDNKFEVTEYKIKRECKDRIIDYSFSVINK